MGRPKKPVIMCGICGDVRLISQASLIAGACSKCRGKESAIARTQAYRKRHPDKYKESNKKACKKWRQKQSLKEHGFSFKAGYTAHQEDMMLRSKKGHEALEKVTNNARAVYKEWS